MKSNAHSDFWVKGRAINGEWVEWNALFCSCTESVLDCVNVQFVVPLKTNMPSVELRNYTIEAETICRFAYMQDSFGEKLYQGDIVLIDGYVFVIAFGICGGVHNVERQVGYYGFYFEPADEQTRKFAEIGLRSDPLYYMTGSKFCKRIGNIFDKYSKYEMDRGRSKAIKSALENAKEALG